MRTLLIILFLVALTACGAPAGRAVTMDGRDPSGVTLQTFNLWSDYRTRARISGQARHGEAATLMRQDGAGCEVRTAHGAQGWVTCTHFILEFKH